MPGSRNVGLRVPENLADWIDSMVSNGTYESRSGLILEAVRELKSLYTGEPTLRSLATRMNLLTGRVQSLEDKVRILAAN